MHESVLKFVTQNTKMREVQGKKVLEIGSLDVNGTVRPHLVKFKPKEYVGMDIREGNGVDIVWCGELLLRKFPKNSMDMVISTETLEHVKDWKVCISNMKQVCREDGIILLTCRSFGFGEHKEPDDYWRFEWSDLSIIFSDFYIWILEKDSEIPGMFMKAQKPRDFKEKNLSNFAVHSMKEDKRS